MESLTEINMTFTDKYKNVWFLCIGRYWAEEDTIDMVNHYIIITALQLI